jgi:hypothetical protein
MAVSHETRVKISQMQAFEELKQQQTMKMKVAARQEYNKKILDILVQAIEHNPDTRFGQLLAALELDRDRFYEESADMYEALLKRLAEL